MTAVVCMSLADDGAVEVSAARKLQALRSVNCYPVSGTQVELIETHFAWVFLVGDYAYKMKKPAAYPLLDLRSLADRHHNCLEEVRLNRRLAPDVYLGAVPLQLTKEGVLRVGGGGRTVDWLVWMKRLRAASMLDRALIEQTSTSAALSEVGALLARELRVLDPAEELAFLRLECEVAGAPAVAGRIIDAYQQHSCDRFSDRLLDCYQSCRALVRAKILAWHILDPSVASLAPWTQKAHDYIELAERHAMTAKHRPD